MSEPARNRFALDLDDLERQLRGAAQPPKAGASVDPLVELTRIVGQDDPLKELFSPRAAAPAQQRPAAPGAWPEATPRREPGFAPTPASAPESGAQPPADVRGALDEFEALLRRGDTGRPAQDPEPPRSAVYVPPQQDMPEHAEQPPYRSARPEPAAMASHAPRDLDEGRDELQYQGYGQEAQADYPEPPLMAEDDLQDFEPRRSRKGLWAATAAIAVAVIGVGGVMAYRSTSGSKDGLPPMIAADGGPTKVAPTNPGGAEIPNQNKQIYERAGEAPVNQSKVVSREEQPVDVQQAARTMPSRVAMSGPGATPQNGSGANPLAQAPAAAIRPAAQTSEPALTPGAAIPGLGEPRRVRTVSIRPDGTPAPAAGAGAGYANGSAPLATGSAPRVTSTQPLNPGTAPAAAPPRRPAQAEAAPEAPKVQERMTTPAPATTPSAPTRVANAAPPASAQPPATAAIRSGTGDFAVQLAAPGSEAEARATFSALQRKYPAQLGGQAPLVKKTELAGGKTVYRLRIGPYSREDATTMCTQLQAAGGQCFIAKN